MKVKCYIYHGNAFEIFSNTKSSLELLSELKYNLRVRGKRVYFVSLGGKKGGTKNFLPTCAVLLPKVLCQEILRGRSLCPPLALPCSGHTRNGLWRRGALWSGMKKLSRPFFLTLNLFEFAIFASCTSRRSQAQKGSLKKEPEKGK